MEPRTHYGKLNVGIAQRRLAELSAAGVSNRAVEAAMRECGVNVKLRSYLRDGQRPSMTTLVLLSHVLDVPLEQLVHTGGCPAPLRALRRLRGAR